MRSKGHKAVIVALVALLVLVVRGARVQREQLTGVARQPNRAQRRSPRLHALLLRSLLLTWGVPSLPNPLDWIRDGAGSVWDSVKGFVADAIDKAMGWVHWAMDIGSAALTELSDLAMDGISRLWSFGNALGTWFSALIGQVYAWAQTGLNALTNLLRAAIDDLRGWAWGAIQAVGSWLSAAIDNARSWAWGAIQAAGSFLSNMIDNVRGWAADAIAAAGSFLSNMIDNVRSWAWGAIQAAASWLGAAIDDLRGWAWDLIQGFWSMAQDAITAAWQHFYDWVIGPIEDELGTLRDWASDAVSPIIGIIEDVADWLIWLAEFSFSEAREGWQTFRSLRGRQVLDRAPDAVGWLGDILRDASKRHVA